MPPSTFSDSFAPNLPPALEAITKDTAALGFKMASTHLTGAMLRALAASKPGGRILELGTGAGAGSVWLLHGMNATATLDTVDNNPASIEVARQHLGHDPRIRFHLTDGSAFLRGHATERFDLVFADTWPGKFTDLDAALSLLNPGGLYIIDDLLPQPSWPKDHAPKIPRLIEQLASRADLTLWSLNWDTGIVVAVKKA